MGSRVGVRLVVGAVLLAPLPVWASAAVPRVVAIGDVHGAIGELEQILREASLTDADGNWIGGAAVLVQTGDFTDRGRLIRTVMDRLRALQQQAHAAGGAVHVLLGNHEAMNLLRLLRDVDPRCYAQFEDADSPARRAEAWQQQLRYAERRASRLGQPAAELEIDEAGWLERHPLGQIEYLEALGPEGDYGRWLRSLQASVRVGDSVFVHGGYSPEVEFDDPAKLNRALDDEIEAFDEARRHLIRDGVILPFFSLREIEAAVVAEIPVFVEARKNGRTGLTPMAEERRRRALLVMADAGRGWGLGSDSPLWFRGYALWSEEEGTPLVAALLDRFEARRLVVGHTVLSPPGTIRQRFGGRVFLIDTGMQREVYDGRPSALEILGETVSALYVGEREVLQEPATVSRGGPPLPDTPAAGAAERSADVSREPAGAGAR